MSLSSVDQHKFRSETEAVDVLSLERPYDTNAAAAIEQQATVWVEAIRGEPGQRTLLDTFLSEYGLSNEEGVALMCLAEAFLRIPDGETADSLILDKLTNRDWQAHYGHADSWLVNASTWALMLTGQTIRPARIQADEWMQGLISRLGKPVVQRAVRAAMQILGGEFVLGETIERALARSESAPEICYSFDMLGEGARDAASARDYEAAYRDAIDAVGKRPSGNSISIKLSALHPRYEVLKLGRLHEELLPRLTDLCLLARSVNVPLTIDAEEADRLILSLHLFDALCRAPELAGWSGLGMVVQAYGKRAPALIDWLNDLGAATDRRIPVRLVKGAYWDAEIKHAQQLGLEGYPVYTRKSHTDAAYLVCAGELLAAEHLTPQFATHNAHTVAAVLQLAHGQAEFEFQRLHGMGEHLYDVVRRDHPELKLRVYAPVGRHEHLLAYLVRRLLENGANSSFVNRLHDATQPAAALVKDPFANLARTRAEASRLPLPESIYAGRENSRGLDLSQEQVRAKFTERSWTPLEEPIASISPAVSASTTTTPLMSPADDTLLIGHRQDCALQSVDAAFELAQGAQAEWDGFGGRERAQHLRRWASQLEADAENLYALLCFEAGKTPADCIDEVREAVDFCRYYANLAERQFETPTTLPGPAGELNTLRLRGRGVFVCISPWNFPLAIFVGQVAAALAAGNCVIAKPAPATPAIAARAIHLLQQCGVPGAVCQMLIGDADLGSALVDDHRCAGVAFTGSTAVARTINQQLALRAGPIVPLIAETGGQNAMIVDSSALLEQVADDVLRSAFGSAGQRCSALRVLYLQEDIAEPALEMICGAMDELCVGHPANLESDVGPIITSAAAANLQNHVDAMKQAGARIYAPEYLLPPGGNYFAPVLIELESLEHLHGEVFGPVLHVRRFASDALDTIIDEINATGFGLTFGLHSRIDERAQALASAVNAGNVYVNRNMIGAVVGSQPFGGRGLSGTGPKAGGPNYLLRFATEQTISVNTAARGGDVELLGGSATG